MIEIAVWCKEYIALYNQNYRIEYKLIIEELEGPLADECVVGEAEEYKTIDELLNRMVYLYRKDNHLDIENGPRISDDESDYIDLRIVQYEAIQERKLKKSELRELFAKLLLIKHQN